MTREFEVVRINAPKFGKILTARPANMPYDRYCEERAIQNKRLKERRKGFLVYKASEIITIGEKSFCQKYAPCVGKKFVLKFS